VKVANQPAYVLHSRPYRDSSLLLELLTPEHGRISLVGKGARRRSRGGSTGALLQVFRPLLISYTGRSELKTLTGVETAGAIHPLKGECLFSGMYLNELLIRMLHRHDPYPTLFAAYGETLALLAGTRKVEEGLRRFELTLLDELGYSFDLTSEGESGEAVAPDRWYQFRPGSGLVQRRDVTEPGVPAYCGADLLAMASGEISGAVAVTAKRLLREALGEHLEGQPLKSRDLFGPRGSVQGAPAESGQSPEQAEV